jgi:hypothetical protein
MRLMIRSFPARLETMADGVVHMPSTQVMLGSVVTVFDPGATAVKKMHLGALRA